MVLEILENNAFWDFIGHSWEFGFSFTNYSLWEYYFNKFSRVSDTIRKCTALQSLILSIIKSILLASYSFPLIKKYAKKFICKDANSF